MSAAPIERQFYSAAEFGEAVGYSRRTILDWIKAKRIPAVKLSNRGPHGEYRIPASALRRFVAEAEHALKAARGEGVTG